MLFGNEKRGELIPAFPRRGGCADQGPIDSGADGAVAPDLISPYPLSMAFKTDAIHAGQEPDPTTGAVSIPIYQTSTYVQEGLGKHKGYEYARTQNPTRSALEANLAAIEGGKAAFCFASGMAATATVLTLLQSGDHVVATANLYGGTYRFFEQVLRKYGLDFTYADHSRLRDLEQAIRPTTRLIFLETPTNPMLTLTDLDSACTIAHGHGIPVA